MSDSESNCGWGKKDLIRDTSSPYRPESKRIHSNDLFQDEPANKKARNDAANATQPPMMLFKHFLNQQDDDILVEEAMRKYNEYKEKFAYEQLQAFFDAHKDEEWFKEKYHPDFIDKNERKRLESVLKRKEIFFKLKESGWLDDISVHINYQDKIVKVLDAVCIFLEGGEEYDLKVLDRKMYRADSPERTEIKIDIKQENNSQFISKDDFIDDETEKIKENESITKDNAEDMVDKKELSPGRDIDANDVEEIDQEQKGEKEPRPLHKTLSIFLRNIHPNVLRSQLEEIMKQFPGYLRMGLQDALPERSFVRRGWITFAGNTDITSVVWQLNKHRLGDAELEAVENKADFQRTRPVNTIVNHRAVMRQDVKYAAKLVSRFDRRRLLWDVKGSQDVGDGGNPLLKNITEYLVDEGSYEEEAYLGGNINNNLAITGGGDPMNIQIEEDPELCGVLDRLLLYLRIVHSFDYYAACEYAIEDDLPSKCGLIHVRGNPIRPSQRFTQISLENHMRRSEARAQLVLDSIDNLDFQVAARLGVKSVEDAVEKFINDNTKEITTEKWLCPLSGKKFKGPEFVQKHIFNKFADRVDLVKETVKFFNNYVLDPRRPQLPEHPSNRPKKNELDDATIYQINDNEADGDAVEYSVYQNKRNGPFHSGMRRTHRINDRNDVKINSYYSRGIMNYRDVEH